MRSATANFDGTHRGMNQQAKIDIRHSTCPHDCPSACALDIEVIDNSNIGRVRGSKLQSYTAGVVCGKIAGVDPREMGVSDLIVIWGTNPVNTQVNVMTHAMRARKERGARIAAIDIYNNDTVKQADIKIILRPGTDGAFACGVMHVLFREGYADRAYMDRYTDCPGEFEAHLATRTPEWASSICGVPVEEIEAFARQVGRTKHSVFRP